MSNQNNTGITNISDFFNRFSLLIITLSGNAAFITLLATWPNIPRNYLIVAHVLLMMAKAWYSMNKQAVPVNQLNTTNTEVVAKPQQISEGSVNLWQV